MDSHDEQTQDAISATLQLQHDAGLMALNRQVLGQYVTPLSHMPSEVMRLAFGPEIFPAEAIDAVAPVPRVYRAAMQMSTMGLWHQPVGPGVPGPMPGYSYK